MPERRRSRWLRRLLGYGSGSRTTWVWSMAFRHEGINGGHFGSGLVESRRELLRGWWKRCRGDEVELQRRGEGIAATSNNQPSPLRHPSTEFGVICAVSLAVEAIFISNTSGPFAADVQPRIAHGEFGVENRCLRARWWSIHSTFSTVMVCSYALLCLAVAKFASGLHILETLAQRCGSQRRCGDGRRQNNSIQGG